MSKLYFFCFFFLDFFLVFFFLVLNPHAFIFFPLKYQLYLSTNRFDPFGHVNYFTTPVHFWHKNLLRLVETKQCADLLKVT